MSKLSRARCSRCGGPAEIQLLYSVVPCNCAPASKDPTVDFRSTSASLRTAADNLKRMTGHLARVWYPGEAETAGLAAIATNPDGEDPFKRLQETAAKVPYPTVDLNAAIAAFTAIAYRHDAKLDEAVVDYLSSSLPYQSLPYYSIDGSIRDNGDL